MQTDISVDDDMPSSLREMLNSGSQLDFFLEEGVRMKSSIFISSSDHNSYRMAFDEEKQQTKNLAYDKYFE